MSYSSLPEECQVTKSELQDAFLVSTYEGLPNLLLVDIDSVCYALTLLSLGLESYHLGTIHLAPVRYYILHGPISVLE